MSTLSSAKSSMQSSAQVNAMCTGCSPIGIDCSEQGFCSSSPNELTAQCTDQCVVIACSDPNHGESVCDWDPNVPCNLACDEAAQCNGCHGFDTFLQCCEEYRSSYSESSRPAQIYNSQQHNYVWDPSFENLWCLVCDQSSGELNKNFPMDRPIGSSAYAIANKESSHHLMRSCHDSQRNSFPSNSGSFTREPLPNNCMWDSCQGTFESFSDLVGHVNTHLPASSNKSNHEEPPLSQDPLACLWAECDNLYQPYHNDFQSLANHIFHKHLGMTPPTGPIASTSRLTPLSPDDSCSTNQSETIALGDEHRTASPSPTSSPSTKQHSCTDIHECRWKNCGQIFDTCDGLTAHITTMHIGSGKSHYECHWDQCPRNGRQGFQSKQKICRHVQSHTGHRPFQCSICQQNFSEAATLQQHIRRHTQEKPYICDFPGCGKSFAITGALTIHKRIHNGDKPFKCSFCDRGFAESSNLSKHLRTHTGARPYSCTEHGCNKSFARPDQLNRHKGVHRKRIRGISQSSIE